MTTQIQKRQAKYNSPIMTKRPKIKPEDVTIDDLAKLSDDSFALWTQTSGAKCDGNKIDFEEHRYLLPIYLCEDEEIVWRKAAQLGATVYMLMKILWWLEMNQGKSAGLYMPTRDLADITSQNRLSDIIDSCPSIKAMYQADRSKLSLRKIGASTFYVFHLGGQASKDSMPMNFMAFDEVRLCNSKDIDQALERMSHSKQKNRIYMSTAGLPGADIDMRYQDGTKHSWRSECGCFPLTEKIWVKHRETSVVSCKSFGELAYNWENYLALSMNRKKVLEYQPITAFHDNGIKKVITSTLRNGQEVTSTPNHEVFYRANGSCKHIIEQEIGKVPLDNKYYNSLLCINNIPEHRTPQVALDNDTLFALGAFIAEGSWPRDTTIDIAQKKDTLIRKNIPEWAKSNNLNIKVTDTVLRVSLHTRPDLVKLFLECGKGCENKKIPSSLMGMTSEQFTYLLQGYIEGDGTTKIKSNVEWSATTTSFTLVQQMQQLCLKLGTPVYSYRNKQYEDKKESWTFQYNPNSTFCSTKVSEQVATVSIRSREEQTIEVPVCDITVDKNHNYVLASGLLVHNCSDWVDLAATFPECVVEDKKRKELYLRCPKCKWRIHDTQRGRYVAQDPTAAYTSFHVSQLASKYISLKEIWDSYTRTTNKEEFYNAKLGLPFVDEQNRGVTMEQLEACVNTDLKWGEKGKERSTAMGIDQGGGYLYITIADIDPSSKNKKRIRHLEIVERNNPSYYGASGPRSPWFRAYELMDEYNVQICLVDGMPNYDDALEFCKAHPKRAFISWYNPQGQEVVQWLDRPQHKQGSRKAGEKFKFKHSALLGRYLSLTMTLSGFRNGDWHIPNPDALVQVCTDEKSGLLRPHALGREKFFTQMHRYIKRFVERNPDTGEGKYEWVFSGEDHFVHSTNYANIALERLTRRAVFTFAGEEG